MGERSADCCGKKNRHRGQILGYKELSNFNKSSVYEGARIALMHP